MKLRPPYTFTLDDWKITNDVKNSMHFETELSDSQMRAIVNEIIIKFNLEKYQHDDVLRIESSVMYIIDSKYVITNREERAIIESDILSYIHCNIGTVYIVEKRKSCVCVVC